VASERVEVLRGWSVARQTGGRGLWHAAWAGGGTGPVDRDGPFGWVCRWSWRVGVRTG